MLKLVLGVMRLSNKLLGQGYVGERFKSPPRKFYDRYGDRIKRFNAPSPESYTSMTLWGPTTVTPFFDQTLHKQSLDLLTELDLITDSALLCFTKL